MALSRTAACQNCRQWLLKSFISTFAIPPPTPPQRRTFRTFPKRSTEARERVQPVIKDAFAGNDNTEKEMHPFQDAGTTPQLETATITATTTTTEEEHIPWYLRTTTSTLSPAPTSPQRLPDLPSSPPPLLAPLLHHISTDLGIDDLTLLDLRALDPPPALGANLLMLIGTARSEKHLHVSADRLCRWLRSVHGLSPFADGLLGRQELKLALRRRARRSKLLGAVGAGNGEVEEGLRTGWVCVNVGVVEAGEGEGEGEGEKEVVVERGGEFVGFGPGGMRGARMVVQMLTEEKRGEVDLEKLWMGVLRKSEREKEAIAKQEDVEEEEDEEEVVLEFKDGLEVDKEKVELKEDVQPSEKGKGEQHPTARIRGLQGRQQLRSYHTSARRHTQQVKYTPQDPPPWDGTESTAQLSPEEFYNTFSSFPALRRPRSAALYTIFFNHLASGAFSNTTSPIIHADDTIPGTSPEEMGDLPDRTDDASRATLIEIFDAANAKSLASETLCAMESEGVGLEGEGGVELGMAILKAIRKVDAGEWEDNLRLWKGKCEAFLRRVFEEGRRGR